MKPRPRNPKQPDVERLLVHGLKVSNVIGDVVTWSAPPTEAEQAFAAELLERTIRHA